MTLLELAQGLFTRDPICSILIISKENQL